MPGSLLLALTNCEAERMSRPFVAAMDRKCKRLGEVLERLDKYSQHGEGSLFAVALFHHVFGHGKAPWPAANRN